MKNNNKRIAAPIISSFLLMTLLTACSNPFLEMSSQEVENAKNTLLNFALIKTFSLHNKSDGSGYYESIDINSNTVIRRDISPASNNLNMSYKEKSINLNGITEVVETKEVFYDGLLCSVETIKKYSLEEDRSTFYSRLLINDDSIKLLISDISKGHYVNGGSSFFNNYSHDGGFSECKLTLTKTHSVTFLINKKEYVIEGVKEIHARNDEEEMFKIQGKLSNDKCEIYLDV